MNVKPGPGRCIVDLEQQYSEETTGLVIPDYLKDARLHVGVVRAALYGSPRKCVKCHRLATIGKSCNECGGRLKTFGNAPFNPFGIELPGRRVIIANYGLTQIGKTQYIAAIDSLLCVISSDIVVGEGQSISIRRCKSCGPAKNGSPNSMIMIRDPDGYRCPRCGARELKSA